MGQHEERRAEKAGRRGQQSDGSQTRASAAALRRVGAAMGEMMDIVIHEVIARCPWGILPVNPLQSLAIIGVGIFEFAKMLRILKVVSKNDP
jgi:hypothetical protein